MSDILFGVLFENEDEKQKTTKLVISVSFLRRLGRWLNTPHLGRETGKIVLHKDQVEAHLVETQQRYRAQERREQHTARSEAAKYFTGCLGVC